MGHARQEHAHIYLHRRRPSQPTWEIWIRRPCVAERHRGSRIPRPLLHGEDALGPSSLTHSGPPYVPCWRLWQWLCLSIALRQWWITHFFPLPVRLLPSTSSTAAVWLLAQFFSTFSTPRLLFSIIHTYYQLQHQTSLDLHKKITSTQLLQIHIIRTIIYCDFDRPDPYWFMLTSNLGMNKLYCKKK